MPLQLESKALALQPHAFLLAQAEELILANHQLTELYDQLGSVNPSSQRNFAPHV